MDALQPPSFQGSSMPQTQSDASSRVRDMMREKMEKEMMEKEK